MFKLRPGHEARGDGEGAGSEEREKKRRLYRFDGFARELTGVLCSVTGTSYRLIYAEIHIDKSVSSAVYPLHCDEPYVRIPPPCFLFFLVQEIHSTTDALPYGTVFVTIGIPLAAQATRYYRQVSKRKKT